MHSRISRGFAVQGEADVRQDLARISSLTLEHGSIVRRYP